MLLRTLITHIIPHDPRSITYILPTGSPVCVEFFAQLVRDQGKASPWLVDVIAPHRIATDWRTRGYTLDAERMLHAAWRVAAHRLEETPDRPISVLGEILRDLKDPINRYFADVLVMTDDPDLRRARLALVKRIAALPDGIADLSQLQDF